MIGFPSILRRLKRSNSEFNAPLMPERPFVVIGDIHGREDLLLQLLTQINSLPSNYPLICVGDYIDRGPDSADVLKRLKALGDAGQRDVICLKGNHEAMFLEFIDLPKQEGPRWLANGGDRTLESFDISVPNDGWNPESLEVAKDALVKKAGLPLIDWVRSLPSIWQSGNIVVTHAGGNPSLPLLSRRDHGLLWGHRDFLHKPRQDGLWVAHGHFIVPQAHVIAGRIAVDTGAYSTDRLSAAVIQPDSVKFLTT